MGRLKDWSWLKSARGWQRFLYVAVPAGALLIEALDGWWKIGFIGIAIGAIVVQFVIDKRVEAARDERQRKARSELDQFRVAIGNALYHTANSLRRLPALEPDARGEVVMNILSTALGATLALAKTTQGTRATFFERGTNASGKEVLRPHPHLERGRGDKARSVFTRNGTEGKAVWRLLENEDDFFCEDTAKDTLPEGWDPTRARKYRTFITVPVYAGTYPAGLLTMNAENPGDLTVDDLATMRVIADMAGTALALVDGKWPASEG